MNITCQHCQAKLNLPDDKIPKDRDSTFKCPKCRESIVIKASASASPSGKTLPAGGGLSHRVEVLVCVADEKLSARVLAAAELAGWRAEAVDSVKAARKRLEYEIFPLIIMDEAFDDKAIMAAYLNELDMTLRRRICLVRILPGVKTGDSMVALHTSSNFVINAGDVTLVGEGGVSVLLASARSDHDDFYRVYADSMRAAGKA